MQAWQEGADGEKNVREREALCLELPCIHLVENSGTYYVFTMFLQQKNTIIHSTQFARQRM